MTNSELMLVVGILLCVVNVILSIVLILKLKRRNDPNNLDGYLTVTGYDEDTNLADLRLTITRHPNDVAEKELAQFKVGTPPPTLH